MARPGSSRASVCVGMCCVRACGGLERAVDLGKSPRCLAPRRLVAPTTQPTRAADTHAGRIKLTRRRGQSSYMAAALLLPLGLGVALVAPFYALTRRSSPALRTHRARASLAAAADARDCVSWQAPTLGSLAYLETKETTVRAIEDHEILIGVKAIGLNYADVFCVLGLYDAANKMLETSSDKALVPGLEYAGEVLEVGRAVTDYRVGDRVFGFTRFGSYTTKIIARPALIRRMPSEWTYAEGAALLVQGLTAWHGLVTLGGATRGSRVLVHSAAGGVGCAAMSICDAIGAEAVGVIGSEAKLDFLRTRYPSCTPLVRGPERRYAQQLAELGGAGYDVVLESLGGRYLTAALDRVAPCGRLVHFGATAAFGGSSVDGVLKWLKLVPNYLRRPFVDPGALVPYNRAVIGFNLIWLTEREDELGRELEQMMTAGGLGERPPAVGKVFPFEELPEALAFLRSGDSTGKVVVAVGEEP